MGRPTRPYGALFVVSALGAGFVLLRLLGAPWPHFKLTYPDSYSFLKVANRGPFHPRFWFDERPVGYPLFLWSVARSVTLATLLQSLAYIGAFVALCFTAVHVLKSRLAALAASVAFVGLAVQQRFALWNTEILSESLSMTLAIAGIVAWWRVANAPSVRRLRWALVWTIAWMLVRDANVVPIAAVVAPVLFVIAMSRRVSRQFSQTLVAGVAAIIIAGAFIGIGDGASQRNRYPMNNNVGLRILPDPKMTAWFVAGGMPLDAALRARTGRVSWDDGEAFLRDPSLARYRAWARGKGRTRLALSMVVRYDDWGERLYRELPNILRSDGLTEYDTFGVGNRLPQRVPLGLGGPTSRAQLFIWTGLAAAGVALAATDRRRRLVALFGAAGLASAAVDIYVSYVGDAIEVNRHLVGPLARLFVMSIIGIALGVERLVTLTNERQAAET